MGEEGVQTSEGWTCVVLVEEQASTLLQRETNKPESKETKHLLYIFSPDLSWKHHAKNLQRK